MKFLADMGVSMTTVMALRSLGYDAEHLSDQGLMRMEYPEIVAIVRYQMGNDNPTAEAVTAGTTQYATQPGKFWTAQRLPRCIVTVMP